MFLDYISLILGMLLVLLINGAFALFVIGREKTQNCPQIDADEEEENA